MSGISLDTIARTRCLAVVRAVVFVLLLSTTAIVFPDAARAEQSKLLLQSKSTQSSQNSTNRVVTLKSLLEDRRVTTMNDVKSDKTSAKREALLKHEQENRYRLMTKDLQVFGCGSVRKDEAPK